MSPLRQLINNIRPEMARGSNSNEFTSCYGTAAKELARYSDSKVTLSAVWLSSLWPEPEREQKSGGRRPDVRRPEVALPYSKASTWCIMEAVRG
jgi:hypothetical protein